MKNRIIGHLILFLHCYLDSDVFWSWREHRYKGWCFGFLGRGRGSSPQRQLGHAKTFRPKSVEAIRAMLPKCACRLARPCAAMVPKNARVLRGRPLRGHGPCLAPAVGVVGTRGRWAHFQMIRHDRQQGLAWHGVWAWVCAAAKPLFPKTGDFGGRGGCHARPGVGHACSSTRQHGLAYEHPWAATVA